MDQQKDRSLPPEQNAPRAGRSEAVSNPREAEYRRDLESAIYRSSLPLSYHDFFVEERNGEIHVSFELALKGPCRLKDEDIYTIISGNLKKMNPAYTAEIMVDRNFISGQVYGADKDEAQRIASFTESHEKSR